MEKSAANIFLAPINKGLDVTKWLGEKLLWASMEAVGRAYEFAGSLVEADRDLDRYTSVKESPTLGNGSLTGRFKREKAATKLGTHLQLVDVKDKAGGTKGTLQRLHD